MRGKYTFFLFVEGLNEKGEDLLLFKIEKAENVCFSCKTKNTEHIEYFKHIDHIEHIKDLKLSQIEV